VYFKLWFQLGRLGYWGSCWCYDSLQMSNTDSSFPHLQVFLFVHVVTCTKPFFLELFDLISGAISFCGWLCIHTCIQKWHS